MLILVDVTLRFIFTLGRNFIFLERERDLSSVEDNEKKDSKKIKKNEYKSIFSKCYNV